MRILIFLFALNFSLVANSQSDKLDFYGDVMLNAMQADHRSFASKEFNKLFAERLAQKNSFTDEFEDIEWISKLYPIDSSFRIMSYQIEMEDHQFKAYGYIQKSDGTVIALNSVNEELDEDVPYMQLDQDSWYGVLYYNLLETVIGGETKYLLFGRDGHSKYDRRKVVDVLSLNEDGVKFGEEIFVKKTEGERDQVSQRLLIEYSADSNVTLNFNPGLDMIVHDHLIPRIGTMPGQGATHLSDGSLVGYKYENEQWVYVSRIYDQVLNEAPRPQPVFDGQKSDKNIMGADPKKKKKRKK